MWNKLCPVLLGIHVVSFENNVVNSYGKTKKHEKHGDMLFPIFEKFSTHAKAAYVCDDILHSSEFPAHMFVSTSLSPIRKNC